MDQFQTVVDILWDYQKIGQLTLQYDVRQGCTKITSIIFAVFITGRNEVVAKVMFLHVCVIVFIGGGLRAGRTLPGQGENPPPGRENPPGPGGPPQEADSRIRSTSGQTHATGMHSCY